MPEQQQLDLVVHVAGRLDRADRHASPPLTSQIPASSAATGHTSTVTVISSPMVGLLLPRLDELPGAGLADPYAVGEPGQ